MNNMGLGMPSQWLILRVIAISAQARRWWQPDYVGAFEGQVQKVHVHGGKVGTNKIQLMHLLMPFPTLQFQNFGGQGRGHNSNL